MTRRDLAALLGPGWTEERVGRLEEDTPNLTIADIEDLAAALEVAPHILVRPDPSPPSPDSNGPIQVARNLGLPEPEFVGWWWDPDSRLYSAVFAEPSIGDDTEA